MVLKGRALAAPLTSGGCASSALVIQVFGTSFALLHSVPEGFVKDPSDRSFGFPTVLLYIRLAFYSLIVSYLCYG